MGRESGGEREDTGVIDLPLRSLINILADCCTVMLLIVVDEMLHSGDNALALYTFLSREKKKNGEDSRSVRVCVRAFECEEA